MTGVAKVGSTIPLSSVASLRPSDRHPLEPVIGFKWIERSTCLEYAVGV